jgi:D-glycero-alpha-D-manno-heptose-7-phosphate kinase
MNKKVKIKVTTPTRIDLAGGTLDLYPLYLFEDGGLTINCAIDQYCSAVLETREDQKVIIESLDLGAREEYEDCASVSSGGALNIVSRAIRFFRPDTGLSIVTENRVHKGSGLGGSSSLLIAVLGALNELTGSRYSPEQIIDIAANVEAQCIGVPTGKQDYFAAMFGGVNGLWFELYGNKRESLLAPDDYRELESRLILSFTGSPRFSGASNWNMLKNYIDRNPVTVSGMKEIKEIAVTMRSCIVARDWDAFAMLVDREWQRRRRLADGVSNEVVEKIMSSALAAGALSNKLCGAGGGGCMITCVRPQDRSHVEAALVSAGAEVAPFQLVQKGMNVQYMEKE